MGGFELIGIPAVVATLFVVGGLWSLRLPRAEAGSLTRVELAVLPLSCFVLAAVAGFVAVFFAATG
jgi:hypothetical protein